MLAEISIGKFGLRFWPIFFSPILILHMGQAASDPIGSARQLKDQDLTALWKSQIGADGRLASSISTVKDSDGRSALHVAAAEGMYSKDDYKRTNFCDDGDLGLIES